MSYFATFFWEGVLQSVILVLWTHAEIDTHYCWMDVFMMERMGQADIQDGRRKHIVYNLEGLMNPVSI